MNIHYGKGTVGGKLVALRVSSLFVFERVRTFPASRDNIFQQIQPHVGT